MNILVGGCLSRPILDPLEEMIRLAAPETSFSYLVGWQRASSIPENETTKEPRKPNSPPRNAMVETFGPGALVGRLGRVKASLHDRLAKVRKLEKLTTGCDVLHVQSLFDKTLLRVILRTQRLPPIVVSLWGSEVLRTSDLKLVALQQEFLRRANVITVTGTEFREIVLSKYGRDLTPKLRETFFSPNTAAMKASIDCTRSEAKTWIKQRLGIAIDKSLVCVGHNGSEQNQHLPVIEQLGRVSREELDKTIFIFPMTYGAKGDYANQVRSALDQNRINGFVLTDFLDESEVPLFRRACDILVYVPVSDSFSATVSQAIAAECVTIVGSWLPYSRRRRAGFRYWEVDSLAEIPKLLESSRENLPEYRRSIEINPRLSMEFFDPLKRGNDWASCYRDAMENC